MGRTTFTHIEGPTETIQKSMSYKVGFSHGLQPARRGAVTLFTSIKHPAEPASQLADNDDPFQDSPGVKRNARQPNFPFGHGRTDEILSRRRSKVKTFLIDAMAGDAYE
ncbi:hypothetical protein EVAR_51253_1 [Eumeta japonica]|uniref:Uncharacterized protein n=1 Tax=Eumeta variegata TaxID=151549 RepID=A0A4C1X5C5_EUMVA|nr:hypothetical protein EVAR_51253_1 [Eumeta japonica]